MESHLQGLVKARGESRRHHPVHQDGQCELGQSGATVIRGEFNLQSPTPDTNPLNLELQGIRGKSSRGPNMGVRIRMSIPF